METVSNSIEDKLLDGLSYKLDATASYITDRKSCTYWATGSNIYAPNAGTKVIKLLLNGEGWLDPSTVKFQFDIHNIDTQPLRTLSGPWSFFRRLRVLCQGQLIEDIDGYALVHQLFDVLQSKHVRDNQDVEGLGIRYDSDYGKNLIENPVVTSGGTIIDTPFLSNYYSISVGDTKTVTFTPLAGIISQSKMIPLKYCPLTFEFEVCNDLRDPVISPLTPGWNSTFVTAEYGNYTALGFGTNWQIENPVLTCDICRMDNELENQFAQRFLSGQTIPISYSTFVFQHQTLSGKTPSVNITRALSRLKSVFCTLNGSALSPSIFDTLGRFKYMFLREWNDFYHPMAWAPEYTSSEEFEIQLQVGGKKFPEYPLRSQAATYSALRKCLGIQQSSFHSINIDPFEYRTHKFIIGIDTEKVLQASFSGENIKNGSLLTLLMKNNSSADGNYPTAINIIMHCDCILNIRDTGVEVLD